MVITNKLHGSSGIFSNILTRIPIKLNACDKLINKSIEKKIKNLKKVSPTKYHEKEIHAKKLEKLNSFKVGYGNIYSSRKVIKNQYINPNVSDGFYGEDIWGKFNEIIKPYIPQGMTLYGEICGYVDAMGKMIQAGYDYGCEVGESFLMPYRITTTREDHTKKEWEVEDVYNWTVKLINEHPELQGKVRPITILYQGTLKDLYPNISTTEHWHENVLEAMCNDKEHFGMEELEPLCKNSVYREGICVRKLQDPVAECFKLKSIAFLEKEGEAMSQGQVDIEMVEHNY